MFYTLRTTKEFLIKEITDTNTKSFGKNCWVQVNPWIIILICLYVLPPSRAFYSRCFFKIRPFFQKSTNNGVGIR
uniref:Putative ovule protein n=1 Tax=Solanum chacoense TaxID=4108 RepID=A0A0V0H203_SOLCH